MNIVSAYIDSTSGTPSITTEHGNWIDSITDNGVGNHTINVTSGIFSSAPICTCTIDHNVAVNNNGYGCYFLGAFTTSSIHWETAAGAGADADSKVNIICSGPK